MPLWVCLVFNSKPLSQFQIKQTKWEHKHMFIVWLRCCNLKIKVTWFSNHFLNSFDETFKNYNLSFPLLPKEFWNHLFEHQRCKISIFFYVAKRVRSLMVCERRATFYEGGAWWFTGERKLDICKFLEESLGFASFVDDGRGIDDSAGRWKSHENGH